MHVLSYSKACLTPHRIWETSKEPWPEFEPHLTMFLAFKMMALHLLSSGPQWFLKLGRIILPFNDFYMEIEINVAEINKDHPKENKEGLSFSFCYKEGASHHQWEETRREAEREKASQCQGEGGRSALISGYWAREAGIKLTRSRHLFNGFGKA